VRKTISLLVLTLIVSGVFGASPSIQVSTTKTNMQPGETGYLQVSVKNEGSGIAYSTGLVLTGLEKPLSSGMLCSSCELYSTLRNTCLEYSSDCKNNLGDVYQGNTKMFTFPISIPANASSGYYTVNYQVIFKNDTTGSFNYNDLSELIYVNNPLSNPDLVITSIAQSKTEINPGEEFSLMIDIDNSGLSVAESIKATIVSDTFKTSGSSNTVRISDISGESSGLLTFKLVSDDSASIGVHEVTVKLNYTSNGENYQSQSTFSLRLGGKTTDFELYVLDISSSSIGLRLANVGLIDAKSVSVKLDSGIISTGGIDSKYIGDLLSGDYAKVSFSYSSKSNNMTAGSFNRTRTMPSDFNQDVMPQREGNITMPADMKGQSLNGLIPLTFAVSYTNPLGERITESIIKEIDFSVISSSSATVFTTARTTSTSTNNGVNITTVISWVFIAGVFVVVAYFFRKSRRKKKVY